MTGDQLPSDSLHNLRQQLDIDFALQAAGLGIWEVDPETNLVVWDEQCRALFGLAKDNLLSYEQAIQFIHPEDVERVNQAVQWAVNPASGGNYDQTYRTIGADDGQLRWVRFFGRGYFTPEGQVYRFAGAAQDVTEQVTAHQRREESEKRLELLSNTVPAMIFYLDEQQRYQSYNQTFQQWFKVNGQDAIGKTVQEFLGEATYQQVLPYLTLAYAGQPQRYEMRIPARAESEQWLDIIYTPHINAQGKVLGIIVMANDITQSKQTETTLRQSEGSYRSLAGALEQRVAERTQELLLANQDLKRSNDNLQQFAYVASHDLQEPLRKIQSFSSLLAQQLDQQLDETARNYLQRITAAGARMSTLIKDLLAYSRISTRQQTFGPVSLSAIMANVLSTLDWEIQQTQASIQLDELPIANGDETQLSQLFQNLLTNALKFVASGQSPQIHIQYFHRSLTELPAEIHPNTRVPFYHQISFTDQGVGFDVKFRDRIFQVFQRLHGKNDYPGSGVGLAIVQRVVENHGGAITASSQPGQGTTFCVYLPA